MCVIPGKTFTKKGKSATNGKSSAPEGSGTSTKNINMTQKIASQLGVAQGKPATDVNAVAKPKKIMRNNRTSRV